MASIAAKSLLALAVSATVLAPLNTASADEWRHRNRDAALIGGVLGLAAGVAVGSALSQPRYEEEPVYVDPPVRRYQAYQPSYSYDDPDYRTYQPAPRPVYRAQPVYEARPVYQARPAYRTLEPWSEAWYDYCSQRYRSFNARSGTFIGNDGQSHFCVSS
ncbi:BA14K family protein [Agrobacterium larrymoorei]|uniref:Lectin-like protein BA14k n=1 Tax=Agrobacterium larrymoorei TaxID=160699 RepID=A0AAF0HEU2_9HYPH|nr:BA14K family protein [Agrobacterium larrymoorei]WHA43209.1 BA14K family protein [Agrobacterium larrymoorei]